MKDKPGFVYVHEGHITRTQPAAASCAYLASHTTRAFVHPRNIWRRLKLFVELVFEILDPGFVSLKEMISHDQMGMFLSDARYSCTSCLISQKSAGGWVLHYKKKKRTSVAGIHKKTDTVIN